MLLLSRGLRKQRLLLPSIHPRRVCLHVCVRRVRVGLIGVRVSACAHVFGPCWCAPDLRGSPCYTRPVVPPCVMMFVSRAGRYAGAGRRRTVPVPSPHPHLQAFRAGRRCSGCHHEQAQSSQSLATASQCPLRIARLRGEQLLVRKPPRVDCCSSARILQGIRSLPRLRSVRTQSPFACTPP